MRIKEVSMEIEDKDVVGFRDVITCGPDAEKDLITIVDRNGSTIMVQRLTLLRAIAVMDTDRKLGK